MENGIYVLAKDDDGIILAKYCESWFCLIQFLDIYHGKTIYVTMSFSDFMEKLKEWRCCHGKKEEIC